MSLPQSALCSLLLLPSKMDQSAWSQSSCARLDFTTDRKDTPWMFKKYQTVAISTECYFYSYIIGKNMTVTWRDWFIVIIHHLARTCLILPLGGGLRVESVLRTFRSESYLIHPDTQNEWVYMRSWWQSNKAWNINSNFSICQLQKEAHQRHISRQERTIWSLTLILIDFDHELRSCAQKF